MNGRSTLKLISNLGSLPPTQSYRVLGLVSASSMPLASNMGGEFQRQVVKSGFTGATDILRGNPIEQDTVRLVRNMTDDGKVRKEASLKAVESLQQAVEEHFNEMSPKIQAHHEQRVAEMIKTLEDQTLELGGDSILGLRILPSPTFSESCYFAYGTACKLEAPA